MWARSISLGIALIGTGVLVGTSSGGPALAGSAATPGKRSAAAKFARIPGSTDADAKGVARVRVSRRRQRLTIKLRRLEAHREYDVLDDELSTLLGTVLANRKGRAKLRLTETIEGERPKARVGALLVVLKDGGDPILETTYEDGSLPSQAAIPMRRFSFSFIPSDDRWGNYTSSAELASHLDGSMEMLDVRATPPFASFPLPDGTPYPTYRLNFHNGDGGGGLPLGATRVEDLDRLAYRIVDGDGNVLVGDLIPPIRPTDHEPGRGPMKARTTFEQQIRTNTSGTPAGVFVEVADRDGVFHPVGEMRKFIRYFNR